MMAAASLLCRCLLGFFQEEPRLFMDSYEFLEKGWSQMRQGGGGRGALVWFSNSLPDLYGQAVCSSWFVSVLQGAVSQPRVSEGTALLGDCWQSLCMCAEKLQSLARVLGSKKGIAEQFAKKKPPLTHKERLFACHPGPCICGWGGQMGGTSFVVRSRLKLLKGGVWISWLFRECLGGRERHKGL